MARFMQSVRDEVYEKLEEQANKRGITVPDLIRAIIIPDWLRQQGIELKGIKGVWESE